MNTLAAPSLSHAGYLILQDLKVVRATSGYRQQFGEYCGVDRIPPIVSPAAHLGRPSLTDDPSWRALTEEWFDSRFGNTAFFPSFGPALRLLRAFQGLGLQLDLIYCQLALTAGEEERQTDYPKIGETAPVISTTYGFDVSWPTCNHSAILQPGVVSFASAWRQRLNRHGLLDKYDDALQLRTEYLSVYPYPPFDIYLVHLVDGERARRFTDSP